MPFHAKMSDMEKLSTTVDQAGRVLIPAKLRKRLDLKPGSDVQISLHGEALVITTRKQAIVKAQAYFPKFANPGEARIQRIDRGPPAGSAARIWPLNTFWMPRR